MRHQCNQAHNYSDWTHCPICNGRNHEDGCASKRVPAKDCCEKRHKHLFDAGQTRGVNDGSFYMWSESHPLGWHPNDLKVGE